ncbi:hypothetical protein TWF569_005682 [Orbilia oligospora]|uniref:RNB domain-containing protein n=1 Tax=Orbilia oligospora TaxID=2813651 RepID=A0A7C8NH22_ORBOL|nr:hypothetical protein TWF706_000707 [Orbilia oligospora]KAF3107047.1 hypothetical protein TWF102_000889 [Orbilia oligospora]KAF3118161.1 hypothetical protein TWF103_000189 [Orbilia oligospora]KAF3126136.1 hypothetical protein TWF703_010597 [Orbilia oligospora]KAF3156708.1 hypothetical protein TWF569_005682 [Orbilia oligospora]
MDPSNHPIGPGGRRLHIGHRRTPSEMTPFMAQQLQLGIQAGQLPTVEQLAIQQQIELLQAQQQQILAQQQYLNQHAAQQQQQAFAFAQAQGSNLGQGPAFQFPPPQPQGIPAGIPTQPAGNRRQSSVVSNASQNPAGGPPPAPSSGASNFGEFSMPGLTHSNSTGRSTEGGGTLPRRSGGSGSGHQRRHSLALPEAKKAAELAQLARKGGTSPAPGSSQTSTFPFPAGGEKSATASGTPAATTPSAEGAGAAKEGESAPTPTLSSTSGNVSGGLPTRSRLSGHGRSHSMAVGNTKSPLTGGRMGGFQFPATQSGTNENAPPSDNPPTRERRSSNAGYGGGHGRTPSRNFEGNWRQQANPPSAQDPMPQAQQNLNTFTPGHRSRASVGGGSISNMGGMGQFQFPGQALGVIPGAPQLMFNPVNPALLNANLLQQQQQFNLQQAAAQGLIGGHNLAMVGMGGQQNHMAAQQQQQRKTLFTPYLPQASLPALLSNGQLVSGIMRVNKKNRSDAYVATQDGLLDADIFICGSKDRNRALEGDLVAVELLDVDEVWGQKKEKEEKKKRKDISDTRTGGDRPSNSASQGDGQDDGNGGGLRRRGSLRQRPTQKKNDDVEVEGQSLLLVEEEEISDEHKPLYAGHIVAVIERVAGQMFSGTLGLLRPSSQATKEKQEAERQAAGRPAAPERREEKPKIVWFKPTDKRVPLIAIPTEQAPKDFVENHQAYANRIFVACIKRWPITSLHPFGTLVEQLGEMGDVKIETDALLRDNNFGPDEFNDAVLKNVGFDEWSVEFEGEAAAKRRDFRDVRTFTIDPSGSEDLEDAIHIRKDRDGVMEIGIHITDVAHFVKLNSLVDREAKKRGIGVSLINRNVPMLPPKLAEGLCSLAPGAERFTVSVVIKVDTETCQVLEDETWIGKSIIKSVGKLSYKDVDSIVHGIDVSGLDAGLIEDVKLLQRITYKFRQDRFQAGDISVPALRLFFQIDDENVPVEDNLFNTTPSHEIIEELMIKANTYVAAKLQAAFPEKAILRRHATPMKRRLDTFADRMNAIGYDIDVSSSAALQKSLFKVEDEDIRKGMETLLIKTMHRAKYYIPAKVPPEYRSHFTLNIPIFTHFNSPIRRYADIMVHRQLDAILNAPEGTTPDIPEDVDTLSKAVEQCNVKKDSAKNAQEQSVHLELCRVVDRRRQEAGGELICEGIVICVYESAFDVLIPEYGFEKRVHCDQLPLKKAEFDKKKRILELYWEKGVTSSSFVPEDERPKHAGSIRAAHNAAAANAAAAAAAQQKEKEEAARRATEAATLSADAVDALFDDDDVDNIDENDVAEAIGGVSLSGESTRPTQSMPGSPTKNLGQQPHRTRSDPKLSVTAAKDKTKKQNMNSKEFWMPYWSLKEDGSDYIQYIKEMTRVPVILRAELSKSPPCLTTRTINPYAF